MTDRFASFTSLSLLLSMRIPVGSDLTVETDMVRVGLPQDDDSSRQATFSIRMGEPQEPGEDWFTRFRREAVARMPAVVEGFEPIDEQDFVLSSFVDVTAVQYRRSVPPERGGDVSQLQAYLWANSYLMYVVDAAAAREREKEDLARFDAILRSMRLLPPR